MSDYITGTELKAFQPDLSELQSAENTYLENNIIARTKVAIDIHCFRNFEDVEETDDMYIKVQLAQKIISVDLFIREQAEIKKARSMVGEGGREDKGDWKYSLGKVTELITGNQEVVDILEKYRDWSQVDADVFKPKTGKFLLEGDPGYDSEDTS